LLEQQKDLPTWMVLCSSQALQHVRSGDADAALREAQRARAALRETSIAPPDTALTLRNLVDALRWAGQLSDALAVCEELTARLAPHGDFPVARRSAAALYLHLGRADLAHKLLSGPPAGATVRQRERLHLALLRVQAALATAGPSGAQGVQWPAEALAVDDLALAAEWALWSGLVEPSPWPLDEVQALARRCRQAGLLLMAAPLEALAAWRSRQAVEAGPPVPTLPAGLHAAAPWAALFAARALQAGDQLDAARRAARHGTQWLQGAAAGGLAPPFRESFLQRHPAHRELLALAARLGA
jgi:tetratricopeptide (TPR) repeat protein